jgi:hypothetical protein
MIREQREQKDADHTVQHSTQAVDDGIETQFARGHAFCRMDSRFDPSRINSLP